MLLFSGGGVFTSNEFTKRLKLRYQPDLQNADAEGELDWQRISREAAAFFCVTPSLNFLANPFFKGQKEKKVREGQVRRNRRTDAVATQASSTMDTTADKKNSRLRENQIYKRLIEMPDDEISFPKLFVDPTSFGETAENLFCCVFLMNQNYLVIDKAEKGLVARRTQTAKSNNTHRAPPKTKKDCGRFIPKLNLEIYRKLVAKYDIREPWFKFDPNLNVMLLRLDDDEEQQQQSQAETQRR